MCRVCRYLTISFLLISTPLTREENSAYHARDHEQEKGEDLEESSQRSPTLSVTHVLGGQAALNHDLEIKSCNLVFAWEACCTVFM